MSFGIFDDAEGNKSSKRVVGFSMIGFSMILALILFIFSFFREAHNVSTMIDIIHLFVYSGTGLLGIGIVENFAKTKSNIQNIKLEQNIS